MSESVIHPETSELSAFSLGQLPPKEARKIEEHISACESCCETMLNLSSDDTFVDLLQGVKQPESDALAPSHGGKKDATQTGIPAPLATHPRYAVEHLIGRGGMGQVYKAKHRMMDRAVALKVINREWVSKQEVIDRFHREVKTAASLTHPNIVTAFDAEQADDLHFLVMEFVDGVDLAQTVKQHGPLSVTDACTYIHQVAEGLQYAHDSGMVHRDIKPHNLMVTKDNVVKILDFGLASLVPQTTSGEAISEDADGNLTVDGAIMGTPDYISPEQAQDARSVDGRSDIYSLGATLYYLLAGRGPYTEGSALTKLRMHAESEPEPLDSLRDDVPDELVAIVSKMMAKDPDERYLTPSEVAEALESFLRTWQPNESISQGQDPLSGGNMSGSGGQKSGAGDMSPDWLPLLGKWLFYMSAIPIILLILDMFFLSDETSDATDRILYYILTSVGLSTIGGILAGIHQFNSGNRDHHRENKWSESQTMLIAFIILGVGAFYLFETDHGVVRIAVNDPSLQVSILGQTITMEDGVDKPLKITPGEWPLHVSKKDAGFRFHTESFKIRRGDEITFKVEVLDDEIVVLKDGAPFDRQEIFNLRRELQDADDRSPASTSTSNSELKITGKTVNKGTAGLPSQYDWNFKGRDVGDLKVRLLLAQNGKTEVMQEFDFDELPAEFANKVRLEVKESGTDADGKRRVNANLFVESPTPSLSTTINEDKGLSIDVEAPFSNKLEQGDQKPIEPEQAELLLALSYWKGDMTHDLSMQSMTAATKDGNVTFLFVTLDWSPASPDLTQLQGEWETVSLIESGKQLAAEDGSGGLLLQIKGNRFVIKDRTPNGGVSDVDTGRIEIGSTATPKTIDFIDRDQPNQQSLGIYELKDGVLRICLVEQGGTDAPEGERIPDTKPLKRPTTFDSPAGSNVMLMEFRRTSDSTRKVVTRRADVLGMGKVVSFVPQESDELATIDKSELAVELWVSGDDAHRVQEGDRVRLEFEGWPAVEPAGLFGGKVISVDPTAGGAGMFRVLIKGDDSESWPDKRYLRPGVRSNCWIFTAAQNPAQKSEARSSKPTVEEASAPAGDVAGRRMTFSTFKAPGR